MFFFHIKHLSHFLKMTKTTKLSCNEFMSDTAGLQSEGLYRISGFSELIEDVKLAFDRGEL